MSDSKTIVVCLPQGTALFDPGPEVTHKRGVQLVDEWDADTVGVVGWSAGGWAALELAAQHPDLPRLVVLSTPFPEEPVTIDLDAVVARTLLLFGSKDPETGSMHGTSWQKRLPNARLEMVPGAGHDILGQMWPRVLSHLAPRRR